LNESTQVESSRGSCPARGALGFEYDHYDPAFALDPHPVYATLREKCPVSFLGELRAAFM